MWFRSENGSFARLLPAKKTSTGRARQDWGHWAPRDVQGDAQTPVGAADKKSSSNPNQNPNTGWQSSKARCWNREGAEQEEKPVQEKGLGPQHRQNKEPIDTRPNTGTLPWHDGYSGSRAAGKL